MGYFKLSLVVASGCFVAAGTAVVLCSDFFTGATGEVEHVVSHEEDDDVQGDGEDVVVNQEGAECTTSRWWNLNPFDLLSLFEWWPEGATTNTAQTSMFEGADDDPPYTILLTFTQNFPHDDSVVVYDAADDADADAASDEKAGPESDTNTAPVYGGHNTLRWGDAGFRTGPAVDIRGIRGRGRS